MTTYQTPTNPSTITVPTAALTEDAFDHLDIDFDEHEQAAEPITEESRLWWFNGLPTDTDVSAIGWHLKAGINPFIDETMEGIGYQRYLVQHSSPDRHGNTDPKPYWRLRSCSLILLAQRLQSRLEMEQHLADRQGIAFAWGPQYDAQGNPILHTKGKNIGKEKRGTVLKFRAFVHELYCHGYGESFPFSIAGFGTDEVLTALAEQYRVLDFYKSLRLAEGKNAIAPFYLFSIPLGPGAMKLVGEPPDQGKIYPITSQIPPSIDKAYLREHVIPHDLIERIRGGLLTETIVWSIDESARIHSGKRGQQQDAPALPEAGSSSASPTPPAPVPVAPSQPSYEQDPFVQQAQLTWITQSYCGGDAQKRQQVCQAFGVQAPEQLRMSHFRILVAQVQAASSRR